MFWTILNFDTGAEKIEIAITNLQNAERNMICWYRASARNQSIRLTSANLEFLSKFAPAIFLLANLV